MGREEDVIEAGGDVERDFQQDEKPDFSGGAEEVVGMQELDPALDRKMHLVNNVSLVTQEDDGLFIKTDLSRHWTRSAGPTITSNSSSSTVSGELHSTYASPICTLQPLTLNSIKDTV